MKKIIAICLTLAYLSFLVGALIPSGLDLITYERSMDGNEKNESENIKGVEVFHILPVNKSTSRVKAQTITQNVAAEQATVNFFDPYKQYTSRNNVPVINDPIFLKIRILRL